MLQTFIAESVLDVLDAADQFGVLEFNMPAQTLKSDAARHLIADFFFDHPWLTMKLDRNKEFLDEILLSVTQDAVGKWTVKINLAKFLLLPGRRPAQELAELREFFLLAREFMQADPTQMSVIQVIGTRDKSGRIVGHLVCGRRQAGFTPVSDLDWTKALGEFAAKSEVLTYYLREVAMNNGQSGRLGVVQLCERTLFSPEDRPWSNWRQANSAFASLETSFSSASL